MTITNAKRYGVWLHGVSGRMGREIQQLFAQGKAANLRLVGGSARTFEGDPFYLGRAVTPELLSQALTKDDIDITLDFSSAAGNKTLLAAVTNTSNLQGKAILLGTTGMAAADLERWRQLAVERQLRLMIAPNTSIGVLLTAKAALLAAAPLKQFGFDIEITETHHRMKQDAPSGTARFLATTLADGIGGLNIVTDRTGARQSDEIGVHSVRGGGIFGEHEIRLIGDSEEVRISHRAFSRTLFATGALILTNWLLKQDPGLYGLLDVDLHELL